MKTELKKLALAADPAYRDTDTDYRLIVPMGHTKRSRDAMQKRCEASGLEYKLSDDCVYVYCTSDDLAGCGVKECDMLVEDLRERNQRLEQEREEREQKQREKEARLLGQYEAMLAVHIEDPRQRVVLGLRLVEAAKEVL